MSELNTRAHWQRTEAMVLFDHTFREVFPALLDRVNIVSLAIGNQQRGPGGGMVTARLAAQKVDEQLDRSDYLEKLRQSELTREMIGRLSTYTHSGFGNAMSEAVQSTVYFPLNLLAYAESHKPQTHPSLTGTLGSIADTLQKPFFGKLCETAALTANGIWKDFSSSEIDLQEIPFYLHHDFVVRPFDMLSYSDISEGLTFDFSPAAKNHLLTELQRRNRGARQADGLMYDDSDLVGTTSGCPVARTKPHFTKDTQDQGRLVEIAKTVGKTPEEITAPRSESAIVFGLHQFAKLLERIDN